MDSIVFYFYSTLAVTAALAVVLLKRVTHSALSLIVCLVAVAGLFFQLGAIFLAATQIVLYAGVLMVLFLLVILLTGPDAEKLPANRLKRLTVPVLLMASGVFLALLWAAQDFLIATSLAGQPDGSKVDILVGAQLWGYLVPLGATFILILAGLVGAVVFVKRPGV